MPTHRNPILSALTAVILLSFTPTAGADSFSAVFAYPMVIACPTTAISTPPSDFPRHLTTTAASPTVRSR
ncbi:hypothetical protein [Edaphobacter modestus]|uniref:hypothetical protein n=1 Tax=Edaphobacter modestus TaxID=388466 RepID=UPI001F5F6011|nr:hypothetical protein [Edaphobacter modestus]